MIFITVGTQVGFDRLIFIVERWLKLNPGIECVAQIGDSAFSSAHMVCNKYLSQSDLNSFVERADLVVAHAGMGSILTALEKGKPIVIFPRMAALGEHRNDHQMATAKHFLGYPGINVAFDESQLYGYLDNMKDLAGGEKISKFANSDFIDNLSFLLD